MGKQFKTNDEIYEVVSDIKEKNREFLENLNKITNEISKVDTLNSSTDEIKSKLTEQSRDLSAIIQKSARILNKYENIQQVQVLSINKWDPMGSDGIGDLKSRTKGSLLMFSDPYMELSFKNFVKENLDPEDQVSFAYLDQIGIKDPKSDADLDQIGIKVFKSEEELWDEIHKLLEKYINQDPAEKEETIKKFREKYRGRFWLNANRKIKIINQTKFAFDDHTHIK